MSRMTAIGERTAASKVPMSDVKFRLVICVCRRRADVDGAVQLAHKMGLWAGSAPKVGITEVVLLATPGEANAYCARLTSRGIKARAIGEGDAPRRPKSWKRPVRRPNWSAV